MVNSIASDKTLSPTSERNPTAEGKKAPLRNAGNDNQTASRHQPDDTLNVSQIGELFSQTADSVRPQSRSIATAEQASMRVARIREQFEQAGLQALAAQTGGRTAPIAALLGAGPA